MENELDNIQMAIARAVDHPELNFNVGKMFYNNAIDKLIGNNKIPNFVHNGSNFKFNEESNMLFKQSIPYFKNAIKYYDSLDDKDKDENRNNLYHCLYSLSTVYIRLGMYDELKPVKTRIDEMY